MSKKFLIPVIAALLLALAAGVWTFADASAQDLGPMGRQRKLPRLLGQVTDVAADQFTIQTKAGQERSFRFDETTRFVDPQKQELSAEDLQVGSWVGILVARKSGEPPLARAVIILPADFDPANWAILRGKVTGVDVPGNAFSLEDKDGQVTTLKVDADTKFTGQVGGLADLQVGMHAQARAEKQSTGDLLAKSVRAGMPSDQRFLGKVTAIDEQAFTIQTRKGESITFQVTEETRFRSRKGLVSGLEDLEVGMPVGVGAEDLGNGQYQALVVLAAPNRIK
jgi:preprotein translocase subunit YajC